MACTKQTQNMHRRLLSSCNIVTAFEPASRQILFPALSPCASAPRRIPHHQEHAAGPRMQHNKGLSEPASHAAAPPAGNKGLSNPASRASATSGAPAQTAHHMPQPSRKHSEARVPFQINPNRVCVRKRVGRGTVKTHSNCN